MPTPDGRVRLTILGGYLGAGKTTWLRHQLHHGLFANAFLIVNEAAETPIDDVLLLGAQAVAVIAGGCVCCTASDDLVVLLRRLCDERSNVDSSQPRLDEIVLETSGLADPAAIVAAIMTDPILVHHLVVRNVVVLVDAFHALEQLRSEPLGRAQIEAADQLVMTKTELVEPAGLGTLAATLRRLNPGADLSTAMMGVAGPAPDFSDVIAEPIPDLSAGPKAEPLTPTRLQIDADIDWTAFSVWLSALLYARGDNIVRVKGVLHTPAGRLLLQGVRRIVQRPELLPDGGATARDSDNVVVLIGRGFEPDDLRRSLQYFVGQGR